MMTEHWLSIAAGVFLVGMMLYGHYRGLLRQCVSLGALVLTIITVKVATPYVTDFVKANPVIRENAAHFIMEVSGWQPPEESESILPAAQRMAIEELKLPQSVKDVLLENNNSEFYRLLGVDQFLPFRYADQYPWFCSGICSQLYSDPFGDPLAEPVVQTAYYMWLKSDGRRDRRACRRISAFVACRIYSQLFYGDSNGADAGSAGKQQYLAFTDLQI